MGFSKNIKDYFEEKDMTIREVAKQMGNMNETLVGRYMASDKISGTFISRLKKYFPEINIDEIISENYSMVNESSTEYRTRSVELIDEIEERMIELKKIVSRK
jgi:hypothetical protein